MYRRREKDPEDENYPYGRSSIVTRTVSLNMEILNYKEMYEALNSDQSPLVQNMLMKIRNKYIRNIDHMKGLVKSSILEKIIGLLDHPKHCDLSLSIVADACMERYAIFEVLQHNGLESILRILNSFLNENIKNRACRALGNIAKCDIGFTSIVKKNPIPHVLRFLKETENVNCQQSALRTLRIFGQNSKYREKVAEEKGIICVSNLLDSSNKKVLLCSMQALVELTEKCTSATCGSIEFPTLQKLVELMSNSENEIKSHALTILKNLSDLDSIRDSLIKAGLLKFLPVLVLKSTSVETQLSALHALCNFTSHIHMWKDYDISKIDVLRAILEPLRHNELKSGHTGILFAIYPLYWDNENSEILFELEIIPLLLDLLRRYIIEYKDDHSSKVVNRHVYKNVRKRSLSLEKQLSTNDESSHNHAGSIASATDKSLKGNTVGDRVNCRNNDILTLPSCSTNPSTLLPSNIRNYCSPSSSGYNTATSPNLSSDNSASSPLSDLRSPDSNSDEFGICWSPIYSDTEANTSEIDEESTLQPSADSNAVSDQATEPYLFDVNDGPPVATKYPLTNPNSTSTNKESPGQNVQAEYYTFFKKCKIEHPDTLIAEVPVSSIPLWSTKTRSADETWLYSRLIKVDSCLDENILTILEDLYYQYNRKFVSDIAGKSYLCVLLDHINFFKVSSERAVSILSKIIGNRNFFEKLIMNNFVEELETRLCIHDINTCKACSEGKPTKDQLLAAFKKEIESDYCVGTLLHMLCTGSESTQFSVLYTVSKLISPFSKLHKIFINVEGLSILLNFTSNANPAVRSKAILSLRAFYKNIMKLKKNKCCIFDSCGLKLVRRCPYKEANKDIVFCVNGTNIPACRQEICEKSDYFKALLSGHFAECQTSAIQLTEISVEALTKIFHFLHGCKRDSCCFSIKRIPHHVLMEMLPHCEKFLIFEVKNHVVDLLIHSFSEDTILEIYHNAKLSNSPALCEKVIEFLLLCDLEDSVIVPLFSDFSECDKELNFYDDIKLLLTSECFSQLTRKYIM